MEKINFSQERKRKRFINIYLYLIRVELIKDIYLINNIENGIWNVANNIFQDVGVKRDERGSISLKYYNYYVDQQHFKQSYGENDTKTSLRGIIQ